MGEFELIDRLFAQCGAQREDVVLGVGDDGAILASPTRLVVVSDTFVIGRHCPPHTTAFDVGYKSLAVNLSDCAAMNAKPLWAILNLTLADFDEDWLKEFARGFCTLASDYGIALVGGDTTSGPHSVISVTILADAGSQSFLRSAAQAGDDIWVSGVIGLGGAALQAWQDHQQQNLENHPQFHQAWCRWNRPEPRLALAQQLGGLIHACLDISDGVLADCQHLMHASGLGADLHLENFILSQQIPPLTALTAGDDYELLFTAPVQNRATIAQLSLTALPLSRVGEMTATQELRLFHHQQFLPLPCSLGFVHA